VRISSANGANDFSPRFEQVAYSRRQQRSTYASQAKARQAFSTRSARRSRFVFVIPGQCSKAIWKGASGSQPFAERIVVSASPAKADHHSVACRAETGAFTLASAEEKLRQQEWEDEKAALFGLSRAGRASNNELHLICGTCPAKLNCRPCRHLRLPQDDRTKLEEN